MFNISHTTVISGFSGKLGTLQQALNDRNLHRKPRFPILESASSAARLKPCLTANGEPFVLNPLMAGRVCWRWFDDCNLPL